MKNIIRKWLEIKDPEPQPAIEEKELRRLIGQAINDALEDKKDYEYSWYLPAHLIRNALNAAIERASKEPARQEATKILEARVAGEAFIDEIVERIKRKQLSA